MPLIYAPAARPSHGRAAYDAPISVTLRHYNRLTLPDSKAMLPLDKYVITQRGYLMTHFEQFIQYRALSFKFKSTGSSSLGQMERLLAGGSIGTNQDGTFVPATSLEEVLPFKVQNVCAKLAQPLVDRLDEALGVLGMTKRDFIELALIDALDKVDQVLVDTNAFEYLDARSEGEE